MTDVRGILTDEVQSFQEWAQESQDDRLRWFATLKLESVTIEDDWVTFLWRDPADDSRHGWRWEIAPDRLYLLTAHLSDDVALTEVTEADENGVRWWGVHLYT